MRLHAGDAFKAMYDVIRHETKEIYFGKRREVELLGGVRKPLC